MATAERLVKLAAVAVKAARIDIQLTQEDLNSGTSTPNR